MELLKQYNQLLEFIDNNDILAFNKFADKINKSNEQWQLITELLLYIIGRCMKIVAHCVEQVTEAEQEILVKIAQDKSIESWGEIYDSLRELIDKTNIYNLDKKQVLIIAMNKIREKNV